MADKLGRLLALGEGYAGAGQWRNAVAVFGAIAEETAGSLETVRDDEGELAGIAVACDVALARALDAQIDGSDGERLGAADRERAIATLYRIWETDIEIGGIGVAEEGPAAIARVGTPEEQGRVAGRLREKIAGGQDDGYSSSWTRRAAIGFLSMLAGEAGLSDEELLKEYREAELWEEAAESLVRLGRIEEGIGLAARRLTAAPALLGFADRLVAMDDEGRTRQAIALIDGRLWEREGEQPHADRLYLAWLEERYASIGEGTKALALARRRFATAPSFATYEAVRRAAELPGQADGTWSAVRRELLALLRKRGEWGSLIDAHLAAGEVVEAVALVRKVDRRSVAGPWGSAIPEQGQAARAAAAAEGPLPEEAIKIYRTLADREIEGRQRTTYRQAATYLERVKALLVRAGRDREWRDSIADLRQRHKSLRALREELDALDLR